MVKNLPLDLEIFSRKNTCPTASSLQTSVRTPLHFKVIVSSRSSYRKVAIAIIETSVKGGSGPNFPWNDKIRFFFWLSIETMRTWKSFNRMYWTSRIYKQLLGVRGMKWCFFSIGWYIVNYVKIKQRQQVANSRKNPRFQMAIFLVKILELINTNNSNSRISDEKI